jgi:hypothetical protein
MNARQFDGLAKTLSSGAHRRRVLGGLVGGVVAALGGPGGALTDHKPGHCHHPKAGRCRTDLTICGETPVHCDVVSGTGCSCILSVEGCPACVNENDCGPACTSSDECERGFICEALGCGRCELTCMPPCPV